MIASGESQDASLLAQPGTVAFLVVFAMGVALFFLFRSMARHLRKVKAEARREQEERFKREQGDRADGAAPDGERPGAERPEGESAKRPADGTGS